MTRPLYICSFTGEAGNGPGITLASLDDVTGRLEIMKSFSGPSPSWMTFCPDGSRAYVVNEVNSFNGAAEGSVTAYSVNRQNSDLEILNRVGSGGPGPAHCSVHPAARHLLVANYGGGQLAVLPIAADGSLGTATDVQRPEGPLGPDRAEAGPPGSFAISGHDASHAHMIQADPFSRFVLSTDLGPDRVYVWTFDQASGKLRPGYPPFFPASAGAGPRHFVFHPSGRFLYFTYEEASQIATYAYDPATGVGALLQQISSLPQGFAGSSFASALVTSRDGRFLYSGNRLHNSIAVFAVAQDGRLRWLDAVWARGDFPHHVALDPKGRFLFACNWRGDQVTVFRVDQHTGALEFTGQYLPVGSPTMIVFPPG